MANIDYQQYGEGTMSSKGTLRRTLLGIVAVLCAFPACATAPRNYDYSKEPDPRGQEYVVGVGDLLRVNVWRDQDLTVESRVRPDGAVTLPLLGEVKAAGRTPSQIRREITEKLAVLYKSETLNVTVGIPEVKSYVFTVSGNAEKPGRYTAESYVTVVEALSLAGGPNRYAETRRILVMRKDANGRLRQIPIDYETLKTGKRMDQNIVILSGDVILIP
jgi:polysaccharide biosynthesis/export protein